MRAAIVEQRANTRLVVISACSGVTNLLVELANGVSDNNHRSQLHQLATIHENVLSSCDATKTASDIYEILNTVTSLAEAAPIQPSKKLTDHLVVCGELMSTHLLLNHARTRY